MKFKDIKKTLLIKNVYYILELGVNILFISFIPKLLVIIDIKKKSIILFIEGVFLIQGIKIRGLYYL